MLLSSDDQANLAVMKDASVADPVQVGSWAVSARNGDQLATGRLYQWLHPRLYAVALSILGNSEDARDAAQDAFLIGLSRLSDLRDTALATAWFRRIVQHLCYRRFTCPHGVGLSEVRAELVVSTIDEPGPDDDALFRSLERVPEKLRLAVMLRYFTVDNDYGTLADRLGVPVGTVRSRLNEGKAKLRQAMQRDIGPMMRTAEEDWTGFYQAHFSRLHFDAAVRNSLFKHLAPDLELILTSKRRVAGRGYVEAVIAEDLLHGSWIRPERVITSGNISVVDGVNANSTEHPDHCPLRTTLVLVRNGDKAVRMHLYDSVHAK